ncbi:4Fe-4S dicluster domain-containing protein [Rhodopila sp.]|uniref:4Fe-4S dicluster domain-containing protein n=1 Tax=Rhodopila sp. TaxID=2480087 RepID=UPI003D0CDE5A
MNTGPRQWRGRLEDAELMAREFPALAGSLARPESRRGVLRLMAASIALGGLAACDPSAPDGHYVPAVNQAADIVPGLPNRFATALPDGGTAAGIVVTQDMGRPIKVEGNAAHPASLGATSVHGQAMLLDFYDPDRSAGVLRGGDVATWQALLRAMLAQRAALAANGGAGFRILTGRVVSPTLGAAVAALLDRYPRARWVQWEPVSRDAVGRGTELAYGRRLDLLPRAAAADVVLALDSDLISSAPGHLRHARDVASRRNPVRGPMSRIYAAEPVPSLIGGIADHRFIAGPREMAAAVNALAAAILGGADASEAPHWVAPAVADLRAAGARALVHAGPDLPAEAHSLVHQVNERLGGRGITFDLIEPVAYRPADEAGPLAGLLDDMRSGRVDTLLILDSNPVYAVAGFREALRRVPFSLSAAPAPDETARVVTWHVPQTHLFETWGDIRAHDGTLTIQQPQALPLYEGHNAFEILALFDDQVADGTPVRDLDRVRAAWRDRLDDDGWEDALAAGIVPGTASQPVADPPKAAPVPLAIPAGQALTLLIRPDSSLWDGRHANNPWLQELPRPLGKLVWANPLLIAPAFAARTGLANGDEVELTLAGRSLRAPVYVIPGQAPDCIIATLGGGRTSAGEVGNGVGWDVTPLRGLDGVPTLRATGKHIRIASTDHHNVLEVDNKTIDSIVRHGTEAEFAVNPTFLHGDDKQPSIYHRAQTSGVAWGMSVDLNACIGCNACVVACQAENNVPVVGRDQVLIGREMHWLRIDRYYEGPADSPDSYLQPMLCMHCEDAPCEPVCPVEASIHDSEGLNLQVYNRCIGTRFCSNNCPYKVRRFNFGAWAAEEHRPPISRNPDVTVRSRGVMEKCTFCVQRIAEARIAHDRDGTAEQVVTACQAACPTRAFSFGDINDPGSEVTQRKRSPLDYALLADQNTHPRLTYEARITNPNPRLVT